MGPALDSGAAERYTFLLPCSNVAYPTMVFLLPCYLVDNGGNSGDGVQ